MVRLSKWIHGEDFTRLSIFMAVSFTAMSQVWFQANLNFYKRWLNLRRCFNLIIFSKEINGIAVLNSSLYMRKKAQDRDFVHLLRIGPNHRQENRRLVGHFYDMKNKFWAVGYGLGWAEGKNVLADYEQLLWEVFSTFCGQKKNLFENIVASALKSCIVKVNKSERVFGL